ncbi:calmodulin-binding receptor-like cytoplasmic kinase 2 isoform X3 [Malania oleifera]|uniref:calmodulin-binding receptor-like cytoplasmic kinase 2 isoform X3 n=1 Tax=Malania oleifera TaxID=397392 RepID=UPI0025ADEBFD|nr:calmodulin-binding receptor-like cytoplasmic kinase 2 isoform X3 [Malania oleifera]
MFGHRKPSSGMQSASERPMHSPSSAYSDSATFQKSSGKNPVMIAAKSVTGVIRACFTPPEGKISRNWANSDEFKAPTVASDVSGASSQRSRSSNRSIYASSYNSTQTREPGSAKFTMAEINKATRNFSPSFKIGQGGFGTVYKARLDDGTQVAVKRAKKIVYDKHLGVEFQSEIRTLAQVEHLNLVKFYGYLEHEDERIVIVEYVPNGTLREHLDCMYGNVLDLAARLDIAIDVAHAVTYLHMYTDHPIIHRDIKSSNILLTENFRAKVADFGFARLGADSESGATHVSTQLLTGRRPIEPKREIKERITPRWAMKKFGEGEANAILDPRLELTAANNLALEKVLELALQCMAPHRHNRPSMRRCAEVLWSIRKDYRDQMASDFCSLSSGSLRTSSIKEEKKMIESDAE